MGNRFQYSNYTPTSKPVESVSQPKAVDGAKIGENKRIAYQLGVAEERQRVVEMIKKTKCDWKNHFDSASVEMGYKMCKADLQSKLEEK